MAPISDLPHDLNDAIEQVVGAADHSIYVLDGQRGALTGAQDDWHDALVLVDLHSLDEVPAGLEPISPLLKFTRDPAGRITYHHPLSRGGTLHIVTDGNTADKQN